MCTAAFIYDIGIIENVIFCLMFFYVICNETHTCVKAGKEERRLCLYIYIFFLRCLSWSKNASASTCWNWVATTLS